MSILVLILIVIVVLALIVYAIQQLPVQAPFKNLIIALAVIIAAVYILMKAGLA